MKIKKICLRYLWLPALTIGLSLPVSRVLAAIVPENNKASGNYTLNDILQTGVNVAQWILGIVGSLTLLMFIYGGFMLLISGGNSESVTKGKKIIMGAIIGLIIVFSSYLIIEFSLSALGLSFSGVVPGSN